MNHSPLDFRNSLTDAEFILHLYKLPIKELNEIIDLFGEFEMIDDCIIIQKILNEKINAIVTRID